MYIYKQVHEKIYNDVKCNNIMVRVQHIITYDINALYNNCNSVNKIIVENYYLYTI